MLESTATNAGDDTAGLVAALGHDLRHLVGALTHQIELLTNDDIDAKIRSRCLQSLAEGGNELNRFVDGLADLERTMRGQHHVHIEELDLRSLIRTVIVERSENATALAGANPADSTVEADPALARRLLQILVADCEATSDAVTIDLFTTRRAVEVLVTGGPRRPVERTNDGRPVVVSDGLAPWIASGLGRVTGVDVDILPLPRSFVVRFPRGNGRVQPARAVED
jgi:hypothetical protein